MNKWPNSARITLGLLVVLWFLSIVYVKLSTIDSYKAVGMNDGSIEARHAVIETLRAKVALEDCRGWPTEWLDSLVQVKDESVNMHNNPDGSVRLCRY